MSANGPHEGTDESLFDGIPGDPSAWGLVGTFAICTSATGKRCAVSPIPSQGPGSVELLPVLHLPEFWDILAVPTPVSNSDRPPLFAMRLRGTGGLLRAAADGDFALDGAAPGQHREGVRGVCWRLERDAGTGKIAFRSAWGMYLGVDLNRFYCGTYTLTTSASRAVNDCNWESKVSLDAVECYNLGVPGLTAQAAASSTQTRRLFIQAALPPPAAADEKGLVHWHRFATSEAPLLESAAQRLVTTVLAKTGSFERGLAAEGGLAIGAALLSACGRVASIAVDLLDESLLYLAQDFHALADADGLIDVECEFQGQPRRVTPAPRVRPAPPTSRIQRTQPSQIAPRRPTGRTARGRTAPKWCRERLQNPMGHTTCATEDAS